MRTSFTKIKNFLGGGSISTAPPRLRYCTEHRAGHLPGRTVGISGVYTLDDAGRRGLLVDIETIWLDRGHDSEVTRGGRSRLIDDAVIAKERRQGEAKGKNPQPMGMRWPVEQTERRGLPPMVNSGATRIARPSTGSHSSHWRSHSLSPPSSSTTETAGHGFSHQSAEPLN